MYVKPVPFIFPDASIISEDAAILNSLTGKLDRVGSDVQIWELSPSTSPLPKHYGLGEHKKYSFLSDSPVTFDKPTSPNPNVQDALSDLKKKSSARLLGQLDAIVNRNNSKLLGSNEDLDILDTPPHATKHKLSDINGNATEMGTPTPVKTMKTKAIFQAIDDTLNDFLDADDENESTMSDGESQESTPRKGENKTKINGEKEEQSWEQVESKSGKSEHFVQGISHVYGAKSDRFRTRGALLGEGDIHGGEVNEGREGSPPPQGEGGHKHPSVTRGSALKEGAPGIAKSAEQFKGSSEVTFQHDQVQEKIASSSVNHVSKITKTDVANHLESKANVVTTSKSSPAENTQIDDHVSASAKNSTSLSQRASQDSNIAQGQSKIESKNVMGEQLANVSQGKVTVTVSSREQKNHDVSKPQQVGGDPRFVKPDLATREDPSHVAGSAPTGSERNVGSVPAGSNTLANVLRQRVRSIRAQEPMVDGLPVGSPTPFRIVSPIGLVSTSPGSPPSGGVQAQPIMVASTHLQLQQPGSQKCKVQQQQQQETTPGSHSAAAGAAQALDSPDAVGAMATVETVGTVKTVESLPIDSNKMVLSQHDPGSSLTTGDSVTQHSTVPHSSAAISGAEPKSPPISQDGGNTATTDSHVLTSFSTAQHNGVVNYQQPQTLHSEYSTSISHTLTHDSRNETQSGANNITTSQSLGNGGLLLTPTTSYVTVDNSSEPIPVIDLSKVPAGSQGYVEDITAVSTGLVNHSEHPEQGLTVTGAEDSIGVAEVGGVVASGVEHYAPVAGVASAASAPPTGQQGAPAGERFLMQGSAGIVLDLSLLDEEDRLAMEMSPVAGSAADAGGSAAGDTSGKKAKPGLLKPQGHYMAGGSPDMGAQVRDYFLCEYCLIK